MAIEVDLAQLGRELKTVDKAFATAVRKAVRNAVKDAGGEILNAVKDKASWSDRIPPATKLTASFAAKSAGVKIVTSAKKAPHGRPYEHEGKPGAFRHPVFAKKGVGRKERVWVSQPARPFFFAAVTEHEPDTAAKLNAAIDQAIREAGFH